MSRDQGTVSASPTKAFFVSMLVRDIELIDAILDLLDNSIDGVIRSTKDLAKNGDRYSGFYARLEFRDGSFALHDNCGGIDPELADDAFRLGRPNLDRDKDIPTVGMYGIGMKRAIFKMGQECEVISQTNAESFKVTITTDWLTQEDVWELPYDIIDKPFEENGTRITVKQLFNNVYNSLFNDPKFINELKRAISSHYCFIAHKGFKFYLNGEEIDPQPLTLLFDEHAKGIKPFIYEGVIGNVTISLAVGFLGMAPSLEELESETEQKRSSEDAGWTVICNDRVVVYKDRTRLTGWGTGAVPSYHTQFITISGVVEFKSNHAEELPVTTTKRGIDGNSDLYLRIKNVMAEGTKIFTNHTNKWKKNKTEEETYFQSAKAVDVRDVAKRIPEKEWTKIRGEGEQRKFVPDLPLPRVTDPNRFVRFSRPLNEIQKVAEFLFEDKDVAPSDVGDQCFQIILDQAKEGK